MRLFDLNIETLLEHWGIEHGLREIIANALDESRLSGTAPISVEKDECGSWHVRDYGRGLKIEHFTMNENLEKLEADGVIGKFGVGLKDALATLDRHGVRVRIQSAHGVFALAKASKHDFAGIATLHVSHEPGSPKFQGTDFMFTGLPDAAVDAAKAMFLCFRQHDVLEDTPSGQVIAAPPTGAQVYISGVWVNLEPGFLFSYNVTSLTGSMRKALNRERVNVGRSVYADRLRRILEACNSPTVLQELATAYSRKDEGRLPEELTWIDVANKALNELAKSQDVVVISDAEIKDRPELIEDIKREGKQIVLVNDREKARADQQAKAGDAPFQTRDTWIEDRNSSFQYRFVDERSFTEDEARVWQERYRIIELAGQSRRDAPDILVSETTRVSESGTATSGVWDRKRKAIVILRKQLLSTQAFAGTLLHELGHAVTGAKDCTRAFENVLCSYLGLISAKALSCSAPSGQAPAHPPPPPPTIPKRAARTDNGIVSAGSKLPAKADPARKGLRKGRVTEEAMETARKLMAKYRSVRKGGPVNMEEAPGPTPGQVWTSPTTGMEFVWIDAMKCWVGKYQVTNGEYRTFKQDHDSKEFKGHSLNGDRQPVVEVSYDDAVAFGKWLTKQERKAGRLPDDFSYRLPGGEEWTAFAQCGNEWPPNEEYYVDGTTKKVFGRFRFEGYHDGFPATCSVEKSGRNDWGIYGVGGIAWEWTSELYTDRTWRILRGAFWCPDCQGSMEFEDRLEAPPSSRSNRLVFRILLSRGGPSE
jgi:formylglycine-generating enzyme required for sulfatase activity